MTAFKYLTITITKMSTTTTATTVVNVSLRHLKTRGLYSFKEWEALPNTVYIGRGTRVTPNSIWGNPFKMPQHTRLEAVELYRQWIQDQPELMQQLHALQGKELGCWCAPEKCHGDVLVELINQHVKN